MVPDGGRWMVSGAGWLQVVDAHGSLVQRGGRSWCVECFTSTRQLIAMVQVKERQRELMALRKERNTLSDKLMDASVRISQLQGDLDIIKANSQVLHTPRLAAP